MSFRIASYETGQGRPVIEEFLDALPPAVHARALRDIKALGKYGPQIGMPHSRSMGSGLFELRIRSNKLQIRIFYIFHENNIYLLHSFVKKQQMSPHRELRIARKRQQEVTSG